MVHPVGREICRMFFLYGGWHGRSYQQSKTLNFNIFVDNLIFIRIFAAPKLWGNEHKLFIYKHLCLQFNN